MADAGLVAPISALEAKAMLDRGVAVAIDVREPAELAATGKVPGALEVPRGQIMERADPAAPDHEPELHTDKPVILYCGSGKRAEAAGQALLGLGYAKVFNLGGLKDWIEAGLPVEPAGDD